MTPHRERLRRTALLVGVGMLLSATALAPSALALPTGSSPGGDSAPADPTSGAPVQHVCEGQLATIVITTAGLTTNGTEGPDVIVGSSGNDIVNGLGGDDRICGNGGNDGLHGDDDSDTLFGGAGRDQLYGGGGGDTLLGEDDSDWLHCGHRGPEDSYDWNVELANGGTLPSRNETDVLLPNSYCELVYNVP